MLQLNPSDLVERARQRIGARVLPYSPPPAVGVGIPAFTEQGRLPVGIHVASAAEFQARFGGPPLSVRTVNNEVFGEMAERLHALGVETVIVGGTTVADPALFPDPSDVNFVWERTGKVAPREVRHAIREADDLTGAASWWTDGAAGALMLDGHQVKGMVTVSEAGRVGTAHGTREIVSNLDLLQRTRAGEGVGVLRMFTDDIVRVLR